MSRPVIGLLGNFAAFVLSERFEARGFGQVLPDQSVGILVGPSLPRVIGRSEVESYAGFELDVGILMELGAVVEGDGTKVRVEMLYGVYQSQISLFDAPGDKLLNNSEA